MDHKPILIFLLKQRVEAETSLSSKIRVFSTGWVALAFFLLYILYIVLVIPYAAADGKKYEASSGSPFLKFFYTTDDLYTFAKEIGENGRSAFVLSRWTWDFVWPIVFTLHLTTAVAFLYGKLYDSDSNWQLVNLAPITGMFLDWSENLTGSIVVHRYPDRTPGIDFLTAVFTTLKWIFVGGS